MDSIKKGNIGEEIAIKYLRRNNYKILETNFFIWNYEKTKKIAEVDVICQKEKNFANKIFFFLKQNNQRIIFLEVKTLFVKNLNILVFPEKKVNFLKKKKIQKAGLNWLKKNKKTFDYPWRMDLITIKILKNNYSKYKLKHFQNILY